MAVDIGLNPAQVGITSVLTYRDNIHELRDIRSEGDSDAQSDSWWEGGEAT